MHRLKDHELALHQAQQQVNTRRRALSIVVLLMMLVFSTGLRAVPTTLVAAQDLDAAVQPGQTEPMGLLITVDSTLDTADADPEDDICGTGPGGCTLRAAIEQANATSGLDGIIFAIKGSGTHTIAPSSILPEITDPVTIDGSTEPGYSGRPLIVLTGSKLGPTANGLDISAGTSTVRGLQFSDFGGVGIMISGDGGNTISGNVFGGNAEGECSPMSGQRSPIQLALGNATVADMNDCDQIVGTFTSSGGHQERHAFIWLHSPANGLAAGRTDLGTLGGAMSEATALNERGEVVGMATTAGGRGHPFLWLPKPNYGLPAGMHDLTEHGCEQCLTVNDINNQGQVVGHFFVSAGTETTPSEAHAYFWQAGKMTDLGILPDIYPYTIRSWYRPGKGGVATEINERGQIIGSSSCGAEQTPEKEFVAHETTTCIHGVFWNGPGAPTDLGALGILTSEYGSSYGIDKTTSDYSQVSDLNNRGQIVGMSTVDAYFPIPRPDNLPHPYAGVSWRNGGGMISLGHWQPRAINDAGDMIGTHMLPPMPSIRWHEGTVITPTAVFGVNAYPLHINNAGHILGLVNTTYLLSIGRVAGQADDGKWKGSIVIQDSHNNMIGGAKPADRNIIGSSGGSGIVISGITSIGNRIQGNYIGVAGDGKTAAPNTDNGIQIIDASNNTIGGTEPGMGNVISGNKVHGIFLGQAVTNTQVLGNQIGVTSGGDVALPNGGHGISVFGSQTQIGGTDPGARNVISGNTEDGILLVVGAKGNRIQGNFIGVPADGKGDLGNGLHGIALFDASNTTIGGTTPGAGNRIAGNGGSGILIGRGSDGTQVQGNQIGIGDEGKPATFLGNDKGGIQIADASRTIVGGTASGAGNQIAYNLHDGVVVTGASTTGNTIRGNDMYENGELAIDLGDDGVTLNDKGDADTGANGLLNFPAKATAEFDGSNTRLSGVISTTDVTKVTVDLYASKEATPSGFGASQQFLGSATPDATGAFSLVVPGRLPFPLVSATATDAAGSTSEFSLGDTDGDSLPDRWEMHGVQVNGTLVNLPAMGANPQHKDIFVHADWMDKPGLKPVNRAIKIVSDAFARGPVGNPDGRRGINLHVDSGPDSVMDPLKGTRWGTQSKAGAQPFAATIGSIFAGSYDWTDVDTLKTQNFDPSQRAAIFHYMCFCSSLGGLGRITGASRGDVAGEGGHDFLVTLDSLAVSGGTPLQQAGTFMHEFGHNLGLRHGGGDDISFKPNYLSIMNYTFQQIGLLLHDSRQRVFDYSRRELPALDETSLDESKGIQDPDRHDTLWGPRVDDCTLPNYERRLAYPALDWDCDAALTQGTVSADVNDDSQCVSAGPNGRVDANATGDDIMSSVLNALFDGPNRTCDSTAVGDDIQKRTVGSGQSGPLDGFADWPVLLFDGGGKIGGATIAASLPTLAALRVSEELPAETPIDDLRTLDEVLQVVPPEVFNAEAHAPVDVVSQSATDGNAPLAVTFDGSASTDPDGTLASWAWDFGDGTQGTGATVQHSYTTPGTYFARLIVTDNEGNQNLVPLEYRVTVEGVPVTSSYIYLPVIVR